MFHSKRLTIFLPAAAAAIAAWAYTVSGVVADNTGEPLADATVRILSARDSSMVTGGVADVNGVYSLPGVKPGKYIIESSYVGYQKGYMPVRVANANLRADTLRLSDSSVSLGEVTAVGVKTPIKVMTDTVEFNADSYKTQPNAVVEDLLKRLPGVEVDADGKITANGKTVTKILVDGKEFFSDDPKVASKNLPVNMVNKLQVVDRKSDLSRLTGVDDGEDETVINLTVKPGMKNGWFGTVEAGYGTDDRYQATFNINRFWNNNQLTFIGSANNTNDLGFTDGNGNRFRRFGGDRGINTSQSFGVNFNIGKEEIFRVGGDVMYSHTDRDTRTRSNRQYLFPDSASWENSARDANDRGHSVRADFRIEWKPDSFNTLDFRPTFSFNQNDSRQLSVDTLLAGDAARSTVNRSYNSSKAYGRSWEFGGRLIYNHNFAPRRGRSFSVMANYRFSNVRESERSLSFNRFYKLMNQLGNDSIDLYDQHAANHTWSNTVASRVSWTEPLGDAANGNFLVFSYRMNYRWNNADKDVWRRVPLDQAFSSENPYDIPLGPQEYSDSLSNSFRNNFFTQEIRAGYKKVASKYNLEVGMSLVPSMSKSVNLINGAKNIPERWVWNVAPFARFRYKFDRQTSLNAFYHGRSSQPSMTQLQPVADYSNPLNVVVGNPSLKPTFSHALRMRFQKYSPETQSSIMSMADVEIDQNSIISKTTYDPLSGGRLTTYENVGGVWNFRVMNMFSRPFGSQKTWSFNNNIFVMFNQRMGYNNSERNRSRSLMVAESPSLAFRPSNLELELRPFYRLSNTWNSLPNVSTPTVHNYGGAFNGTYFTPFGLVLATDISYTASSGYAAGYNQNQWMWNASVSYQFLRNRQATVMLKVYDLLQQQQNVNRSVTANYIDDTEYNSLTRYFMLTFTYRFNTFGKGNEPADNSYRSWGGPGGHRGPGGPPPGRR